LHVQTLLVGGRVGGLLEHFGQGLEDLPREEGAGDGALGRRGVPGEAPLVLGGEGLEAGEDLGGQEIGGGDGGVVDGGDVDVVVDCLWGVSGVVSTSGEECGEGS